MTLYLLIQMEAQVEAIDDKSLASNEHEATNIIIR